MSSRSAACPQGGDETQRSEWRASCCSRRPSRLGRRAPASQRPCHVGWVYRDALIAGAEYGVDPVETAERCTARARVALVAGLRHIVEVVATRPLQQIAAGGGLIP